MTLYEVVTNSHDLACADCGCRVDGSERGRAAHQRWHEFTAGIDLITLEREQEATLR